MTGPIYNAVRHSSSGSNTSSTPSRANSNSTAVRQVSPTTSNFSGTTANTITKRDLQDATKHRKGFAIFTAFLFLVTLVFLILINIGNVSNMRVLGDLYFFKIDVSRIVPASSSSMGRGRQQISIANQIGLHDFYQIGLWNFCEGYNGKGITACSKPTLLYWFNPVQIISDELLEGASIALPEQVTDYLNVIRTSSRVMFVCFFASTFSSFLSIFLCPLAVYSKLVSIPVIIFTLASALCTTIGACISTALWTIFRKTVATYAADINVVPTVGMRMMAFVWIAAGCALFAAVGQIGMLCCGTSRRDIKTGRRVGRKQRTEKIVAVEENPALRRRWWGSVSN